MNDYTEIYVPFVNYPQSSYKRILNQYLKWKVDPIDGNLIIVEASEYFLNSQLNNVIGSVEIHPTL
jgi:hypothetical protein